MSLDEALSVLTICSLGTANLVATVRHIQTLRGLLIGEKEFLEIYSKLQKCERLLSERG